MGQHPDSARRIAAAWLEFKAKEIQKEMDTWNTRLQDSGLAEERSLKVS